MKKSYNKLSVLAKKHSTEKTKFSKICEKFYGSAFNEIESLKDNDKIIDTLDYGTDCLPFEEFDELMEANKETK